MCYLNTVRCPVATVLAALVISGAASTVALGQTAADWHHTGNAAIAQGLAGLSSGPVNRVWFDNAGATVYAVTSNRAYAASDPGRVFATSDLDTWQISSAAPPPGQTPAMALRH